MHYGRNRRQRKDSYLAYAVPALVATLAELGVAASDVLQGSGISVQELTNPLPRASVQQLETVYRNVMALASDPAVAVRAGSRLHLPNLGVFGSGLVSSPDFAGAMEFLARYEGTVSPFSRLHYVRRAAQAAWVVEHRHGHAWQEPLGRFIMEFKLTGLLTVLRDLFGAGITLQRICLRHARPPHGEVFERLAACEVRYEQAQYELQFSAPADDWRMPHADQLAHALMRELCEGTVRMQDGERRMAPLVRSQLMACSGEFPDLETTANFHSMSVRTLRRRLTAEGTSYRALMDEVRTQLALSYLQDPGLTIDEIALLLGFSDAPNFRRAYARWTGQRLSTLAR